MFVQHVVRFSFLFFFFPLLVTAQSGRRPAYPCSCRWIWTVVTNLAASVAGLTWMLLDYRFEKKWSAVGFCSGAIAGLVAVSSFFMQCLRQPTIVLTVCGFVFVCLNYQDYPGGRVRWCSCLSCYRPSCSDCSKLRHETKVSPRRGRHTRCLCLSRYRRHGRCVHHDNACRCPKVI
jgi:hypothetical protein